MIVFWGKLAGLAVGVFGGLIGAVFGLIVGHLLDLVAAEYLLRQTITKMTTAPPGRTPRTFSVKSGILALAVAGVARTTWKPAPEDRLSFEDGCNRLDPPRWRFLHRGRPRYLDAALAVRSRVDTAGLREQIMTQIPAGERPQFIQLCRNVLDVEVRGRVLERLRHLASSIDLPSEWINTWLPAAGASGVQGPLDSDVCRILGVRPDTEAAEIRRVYRKLAAQFHPDTASGLTDDQREQSAAAFVTIREAYEQAMRQLSSE